MREQAQRRGQYQFCPENRRPPGTSLGMHSLKLGINLLQTPHIPRTDRRTNVEKIGLFSYPHSASDLIIVATPQFSPFLHIAPAPDASASVLC